MAKIVELREKSDADLEELVRPQRLELLVADLRCVCGVRGVSLLTKQGYAKT